MLPIISVLPWLNTCQRQFPFLLHEHKKSNYFLCPIKHSSLMSGQLANHPTTTRCMYSYNVWLYDLQENMIWLVWQCYRLCYKAWELFLSRTYNLGFKPSSPSSQYLYLPYTDDLRTGQQSNPMYSVNGDLQLCSVLHGIYSHWAL